jgi:hypothetical protein
VFPEECGNLSQISWGGARGEVGRCASEARIGGRSTGATLPTIWMIGPPSRSTGNWPRESRWQTEQSSSARWMPLGRPRTSPPQSLPKTPEPCSHPGMECKLAPHSVTVRWRAIRSLRSKTGIGRISLGFLWIENSRIRIFKVLTVTERRDSGQSTSSVSLESRCARGRRPCERRSARRSSGTRTRRRPGESSDRSRAGAPIYLLEPDTRRSRIG